MSSGLAVWLVTCTAPDAPGEPGRMLSARTYVPCGETASSPVGRAATVRSALNVPLVVGTRPPRGRAAPRPGGRPPTPRAGGGAARRGGGARRRPGRSAGRPLGPARPAPWLLVAGSPGEGVAAGAQRGPPAVGAVV